MHASFFMFRKFSNLVSLEMLNEKLLQKCRYIYIEKLYIKKPLTYWCFHWLLEPIFWRHPVSNMVLLSAGTKKLRHSLLSEQTLTEDKNRKISVWDYHTQLEEYYNPPVDYYKTWDMTSFITIMCWYVLYGISGNRISEKLVIMSSPLKDFFTSYKMVFLCGTLGH